MSGVIEQALSVAEIGQYATDFGWRVADQPDRFAKFFRIMSALDNEFRSAMIAKRIRNQPPPGRNPPGHNVGARG